MKKKSNLLFISIIFVAIIIIVEILYIADYRVKNENNYYNMMNDTFTYSSEAILDVIENNIENIELRLNDYAVQFVEEDITYQDEAFRSTILHLGTIRMIDQANLTGEELTAHLQGKTRFMNEAMDYVIMAPIIKADAVDGYIIATLDEATIQNQLLHQVQNDQTRKIVVFNREGTYLVNRIGTNNMISDFTELEVSSAGSLFSFIEQHSLQFFAYEQENESYLGFFNQYEDDFYVFISMEKATAEAYLSDGQTLFLAFLMRTSLLLAFLFIFVLLILYIVTKFVSKNEIKIETMNTTLNGGVVLTSFDPNLKIRYGNEGFYQLLGYQKKEIDQVFDGNLSNMIYEKDIDFCDNIIDELNRMGRAEYKIRLKSKNKGILWLHMNCSYHSYDGGAITIVLLDITESKTLNSEIKSLIATIPGGVIKLNALDGKILFASDSLYTLLGYDNQEAKRRFAYLSELIAEEDLPLYLQVMGKKQESNYIELRLVGAKTVNWVSITMKKVITEENEEIYQCVILDMSEQKQASNQLQQELAKASVVLEMIDEFICEYVIESDLLLVSRKLAQMLDIPEQIPDFTKELTVRSWMEPSDLEKFLKMLNVTAIQSHCNMDFRLRRANNDYEWFNMKSTTLFEENKPIKIISKITNIHEQKTRMAQLMDISQRDSLTGLYNNSNTMLIINDYLQGNGANGSHVFLIIDMDGFKKVNDRYGHAFGDQAIQEFANRLKKLIGNADIAGRIGGDEFVVLIKNIGNKLANNLVKRLVKDVALYLSCGLEKVEITVSAGAAMYPEQALSYEELYKKADIACYVAKSKGKNTYCFYDEAVMVEEKEVVSIGYHANESEAIILKAIDWIGNTPYIEQGIRLTMEEVCIQYLFDKIFLFEHDELVNQYEYTFYYNYVKDRITYHPTPFANNPISKDVIATIDKDSLAYVNDIETLKKVYPLVYDYLAADQTKSIVAFGVFEEGKLKAIFVLTSPNAIPLPKKQDTITLFTVGRLILAQLVKMRKQEKTSFDESVFQEIIKERELSSYAVNNKTYELVYLSQRLQKLYPEARVGDTCYVALKQEKEPCANCPMRKLVQKDRHTSYYYDELQKQWMGLTATKVKNGSYRDTALLYSFDLTSYVERVSFRDPLTGMYNLSKFVVEANRLIQDKTVSYALISADITDFRFVNETYGYLTGDQLLLELGQKIQQETADGEICARVSGDRFVFLWKVTTDKPLDKRLQRMSSDCTQIKKKHIGNASVSFALGIYLLETMDEEITLAMNKSEMARKTVKGKNTNRAAYYNPAMVADFAKEKQLESKMEEALAEGKFILYYQPKYDITTEKIVGCEALTRWQFDQETLLPPIDFIPLFEKNGFINKLSYYISEQVFILLRKRLDKQLPICPISINISYYYLCSDGFLDDFIILLKKYKVPPQLIEIELTETLFKENIKEILSVVRLLRDLGFKIAIDDFGSGYSSLILLRDIPVDILKLDKGFFKNNNVGKKEMVIIENITIMAKELGFVVVSEGVETLEHVQFLKQINCQYAQGYYFDRPMPIEQLEKKIK